jgi:hypothetical protein
MRGAFFAERFRSSDEEKGGEHARCIGNTELFGRQFILQIMPSFKKQRVVETKFRVFGSKAVDAAIHDNHDYFLIDDGKIQLRAAFKGFVNDVKVYGIDSEDVTSTQKNIVITKIEATDSNDTTLEFSFDIEYLEIDYVDM